MFANRGERAEGSARFASSGEQGEVSARVADRGERAEGSAWFASSGEHGECSARFAGRGELADGSPEFASQGGKQLFRFGLRAKVVEQGLRFQLCMVVFVPSCLERAELALILSSSRPPIVLTSDLRSAQVISNESVQLSADPSVQ